MSFAIATIMSISRKLWFRPKILLNNNHWINLVIPLLMLLGDSLVGRVYDFYQWGLFSSLCLLPSDEGTSQCQENRAMSHKVYSSILLMSWSNSLFREDDQKVLPLLLCTLLIQFRWVITTFHNFLSFMALRNAYPFTILSSIYMRSLGTYLRGWNMWTMKMFKGKCEQKKTTKI